MSRVTLTTIVLLAASGAGPPAVAVEAGPRDGAAEASNAVAAEATETVDADVDVDVDVDVDGDAPPPTRLRLFYPAWAQAGDNPHEIPAHVGFVFGQLPPEAFDDPAPDTRFIRQTQGPYASHTDAARLPDAIFARDEEGQKIESARRPHWLVIPDHPNWLEELARRTERMMDSRFDGLLIEGLSAKPLGPTAIDPATGEPYDAERWLAAGAAMLRAVREAMPAGKLLTINGAGRGADYWAEPTQRSLRMLLDGADGVMSDSLWREPDAPLDAWPTVEQWRADVEMIRDVEQRGLIGFWATICRPAELDGEAHEVEALVARWRRFALASHLLAAGPHSHFFFADHRGGTADGYAARFPEYEAPLGEAVGPMEPIGDSGAYARRFTGGLVLVNPTDKPLAIARWPWNQNAGPNNAYRSWGEDRTVRLPLSVPTHVGLILTPAEAPEE